MKDFNPTEIGEQDDRIEQAKLRDKLASESEGADFKWLMSSKRGRRILYRQLERAGVFRISFSTNAMQMAFNEGNRNEGLYILRGIHSQSPELYPTMIMENKPNDK
jgi:hypothetical protein